MHRPRRSLQEVSPAIAVSVDLYTEGKLAEALSNDWTPAAEVGAGQHFNFLREYLGPVRDGLHAQTIVQEFSYVSQSYLEDYAHYYAHCFVPYERDCRRVHFFSHPFDEAQLLAALPADDEHDIWKSYLGYIVIKPIPAPLGATLLRSYTDGPQHERHYAVQRPYAVNLLGKKLTIPTLIWQQQDNNVSACATTALWVAFHKTAYFFQHPMPSPYRITESAGNLFQRDGRTFPNHGGLDQHQIMTAVQSVGLVAELRNSYRDPAPLPPEAKARQLRQAKGFLYAYLKMGLPALLFIKLQEMGGHLITATGYREPEENFVYQEDIEDVPTATGTVKRRHLTLYSDGIERAYAHDDGVGPYSRLGFEASTGLLVTSWPTGPNEWRRAALAAIAFPPTEYVRISYEQIHGQASRLNELLNFLRPIYEPDPAVQVPVIWDIYLQTSNEHKQKTWLSQLGTASQRERIATRLLPKYVWVARALYQSQPLMEFVFDASDLHTGFYCLLTTTYAPLRASLTVDVVAPTSQIRQVLEQLGKLKYLPLLEDDLGLPPTAP